MATTFSTNANVVTRIEGGTDTLAVLTGTTPYSAAVVDAARDKAAGWIRAKIGVRFALPTDLSSYAGLPEFLRELELDLVEEELWSRVREKMPQRVIDKGKQARDLLDAIAKGQARLGCEVDPPAASSAGSVATATGAERVFTRDQQDGMF